MEIIEIISESENLTLRQRWAVVFTIVTGIAMLVVGFNLRNQVNTAVASFENPQAGISAFYPQGWLLDSSPDYILRVRDMSRSGFKTVFAVSIIPVGTDASERNIADSLTLDRLETLIDYRVQPLYGLSLPDGREAQALEYTYVDTQASPFLAGNPSVVRGMDLLVISGEQAVIITYRAELSIYEQQYPIFLEFLRRLVF
jgi:hypothetical protein